ncbi:MAG: oxygen-independent coproporphyrinogen III oxidase [Alphaproteobacteria bacterium]|nr:oxygen-independent coproporphyrinogen III oxidase [Alphaproteobacteria bacterium]
MTQNLRTKILAYDRLVPRYTSYPTAPHFKPIEGDDTLYRDLLTSLPEKANISLYLHVPFCSKMCWYCGCHTKITERYAPVEDYAHLMLREIDMLSDVLPPSHTIQNIHFGGGSPGLLRACDFEKIIDRIRSKLHMGPRPEIAIEIDPRGVTESRAAAYAASGVTRISLGVQDFDDKVLESVNRVQPFELSEKAVKLFRSYGIDAFNFDLLYGLPHQTPQNMEETIEKALSLTPHRISLFGYAHVPWMKKHMRLIDEKSLPDHQARYDLFETGAGKLEEAGYIPIGIDHFAKPDDPMSIALREGRLHRNFQGYTTEATDALIGIGASSIGKFSDGYTQNAVAMPQYKDKILGGHFAAAKYCPLTQGDKLRAEIIERLMCDFTADIGKICSFYGYPEYYLDDKLPELKPFVEDQFVTITNQRVITVVPHARQLVRIVCSIFDEYISRTSTTPRHAKAI